MPAKKTDRVLSVAVPKELHDRLAQRAKREDRSLAAEVRHILAHLVETKKIS